jgi:hypothetical protein
MCTFIGGLDRSPTDRFLDATSRERDSAIAVSLIRRSAVRAATFTNVLLVRTAFQVTTERDNYERQDGSRCSSLPQISRKACVGRLNSGELRALLALSAREQRSRTV